MTAQTEIAPLQWSEALVLGDAKTDTTHQEFIDLVQKTEVASGTAQTALYTELVAHTVEHFGQEERWMLAAGLSASHCHFSEHRSVLEVMKEVERRAALGETHLIANMLEALAEWFPMHATSMDAGLVEYLQTTGFDTATETFLGEAPTIELAAPSQGCGTHHDHNTHNPY
jgi:hemerythrin-like metal-binding protein